MTPSHSPAGRRRSSTTHFLGRLLPPRSTLLLVLVSIIILTVFHIHQPSNLQTLRQRTPRSLQHAFSTSSSAAAAAEPSPWIPLQSVLDRIDADIASSAASYDSALYYRELGLKLGSTTTEEYIAELSETYNEFFSPASPKLLDDVLSRLSHLPRAQTVSLPKQIYTTDLRSPDQFPEQFKSWSEKNPDWETLFVEDEAIEGWVSETVGEDAGVLQELHALRAGRGVLRADLFSRYLVLLLNGGVYTDTDTACVRPLSQWAVSPDRPTTHPLAQSLPTLLELADESLSTQEDSPALIVALEADAPDLNTDWRGESFVRGIQVVQWTIQAKRAHPILLDVLGRGLREAKRVREAEERGEEDLEWTGPGAFTDAVMRYLLVHHGVHPGQLSGLRRPVRYGDIVIMPVHSFRADASEGDQGEDRVVWHGFFGRWKN
ncbi:hypothetical protein BCR39DRAFT_471209 [Naematelia encephala]|uniref:Glycosyltransferase family 32 protein n=1 Tax=Naematelia encephala TaxID=71784 RepID=A0A1Y2ASS3_9TREE|nr:hypothetical protein BCR39DRAFT_471209 [Naematelia encephala]